MQMKNYFSATDIVFHVMILNLIISNLFHPLAMFTNEKYHEMFYL